LAFSDKNERKKKSSRHLVWCTAIARERMKLTRREKGDWRDERWLLLWPQKPGAPVTPLNTHGQGLIRTFSFFL
jgi:hypothetical protein